MLSSVVIPLALAACAATMTGGLFAILIRDRLHLVLGFSAGAVIGLAYFDLMPEAIASGGLSDARGTLMVSALGFFIYAVLDRVVLLHAHADPTNHGTRQIRRGWMGAGSLSIHSFLDGFAIGVAFQASHAIGLVVTAAVLVHDFSDGLNTVNMVVKSGGDRKNALRWLMVDALAPVMGATASLLIALPPDALSIILALFSGFFLYIGASDLLPESHHAHPRFLTTITTLLGAGTMYGVTKIVSP